MKLIRDILGRLLYVILGAIITPIAFTIIFPPKHRVDIASQSIKIAEILDNGLKANPEIFSSPAALSNFISKNNTEAQDHFNARNLLLAVVSESNQIPSFYILLPGGDYYAHVNPDGKAMLDKIKTTNK